MPPVGPAAGGSGAPGWRRRGRAGLLLAQRAEVTPQPAPTDEILTGADALGDWTTDAPGVKRKITVADLPAPNEGESVTNSPSKADRPAGVFPKVPSGFTIAELATGLEKPRVVQVAPNGDVFVAESAADWCRCSGHGRRRQGRPPQRLRRGPQTAPSASPSIRAAPRRRRTLTVNTDSVVRFPYKAGDTRASGPAEALVATIPSGKEAVGGGGHWTRDIAFSKDNQRMFVSGGLPLQRR